MFQVLVAIIAVCVAYLFWTAQRKPERAPPGPWRLPVLGNLLALGSTPHLSLQRLGKKYGGLFSLQLGERFVVVANDLDTVVEVLQKKGTKTAGRPRLLNLDAVTNNGDDMSLCSYGAQWRTLRKLAYASLFSKTRVQEIEPTIHEEVSFLLEELRQINKTPVDLHTSYKRFSMSVIGNLMFGRHFDKKEDKDFETLYKAYDYVFEVCGNANPADYFSPLRLLPSPERSKLSGVAESIYKFLGESWQQHKKALNPEQPKDFIDQVMVHREKEEFAKQAEYMTDNRCLALLNDIFAAGIDTTSTALEWFTLYMIHFPEVQKKIHAELDERIQRKKEGQDNKGGLVVTTEQKDSLPYLNATIMESLRFIAVAPFGVPHMVMEDVEVQGYILPKGAMLLPNLYAAMMDDSVFVQPDVFRPERFLEDPELMKKMVPFSLGPRQCPGNILADAELFVAISNMMYHFSFLPVDPKHLPSLEGVYGLTLHPKNFHVRVVPRQQA
ncbi:Steroid 17-alpha-hydroxylase/17,20 lyase [Balamuthia mandrillaris]